MAAREVVAMTPESWISLTGLPLLAFFIALPALGAWRRRSRSRLASEAATGLAAFAESVRRECRNQPLDESLREQLIRLRLPEMASLQLAQELGRHDAALLADSAQRVALRLRRRVAFERKMLARTASGLRRGAIAASIPPLAVCACLLSGVGIPPGTLMVLAAAEILGCILLWQLARVEI